MSFAGAADVLNIFFGLAGTSLGISSTVLKEKLKDLEQEIDNQVGKNIDLINASTNFQSSIAIITSPVLKIQQNLVDTSLKINLQEIQHYYEDLKKFMGQYKSDEFNTIMRYLPGSTLSAAQIPASVISQQSLFGVSVISSIFSVHQTIKLYTEWKNAQYPPSPPPPPSPPTLQNESDPVYSIPLPSPSPPVTNDYPLLRLVGQTESTTYKVVRNSYDVTPVARSKFSIISSMIINQLIYNSATFKQFLRDIFTVQGKFFEKSSITFGKIAISLGLVSSIAQAGLSIFSIIESTEAIKAAEQKLQDVKNNLKQLFNQCLGILHNIQEFMEGFEAQIFSFPVFLSYVQLICTHNLLASDDPQKYSPYIEQLKINQITQETFQKIRDAKIQIHNALLGMNITRTEVGVGNNKTFTYTSNQTSQSISKRFSDVTGIISTLDKTINMTNIYNTYYSKLRQAQTILKQLKCSKARDFLTLVSIITNAVNRNKSLDLIQFRYLDFYKFSQDYQLTQHDHYKIAEIISFTTNTFPKNSQNTNVYGIELSTFKQKLSPQDLALRNTQIQDLDMGNIMGSWPEDRKQESIQEILKQNSNITADKLTYWGSSIYIVNKGDAVTPKWQISRLQAFDALIQGSNKQRYYAFYDSITNRFDKVVPGPLETLSNIKLQSS